MWVRALVAAVVVGAGLLAVPSHEGPAPSFELAPLRAGDAAAYTMALEGGWILPGPAEGPRFEVLEPALVTRADGSRVHAFPIRSELPATTLLPPQAGPTWTTWSGVQWLDGVRIATQTEGAHDALGRADADQQVWSYPAPNGDCILTGPGPCDLPGLRIRLGPATVHDEGVVVEERAALRHLHADDGATRIDWWYAPGISVPVRLTVTAPGAAGLAERQVTFNLEGFLRGEGASEALASGFAPTPLQWLPSKRWGPDDAGMDVPFPLSAAYQAATQEPTWPELRQWLARHPDAWVFMAEPSRDGLAWSLHLSDGEAGFSVRAERTEAVLPIGSPSVHVQRLETHPMYWAAAPRPELMPSVASLWARWDDHARGTQPNLWAHQALVGSAGAHIEYSAARAHEIRWGLQGLEALGLAGSRSDTALLVLDGSGEATHFHHGGAAQGLPTGAPPYAPASLPYIAPHWPWSAAATGAGAAGLAALALAPKAILALFTRFRPGELLEHPLRATIMDAVRAEPGLHFRALCDRLDCNPGRARHHVRKLVEGGHIIQRASPGYTCYFAHDGTSRGLLQAGPLMRSDGARNLVGAIRANPGASAQQLASAAGLSPATATYHLKRLQQAGLVDVRRDGRCIRMSLTPDGAQAAAVMA